MTGCSGCYVLIFATICFVYALGSDNECEDRYKALHGHSRCLPRKSPLLDETVQNAILNSHNEYRQRVSPPADNMRKLMEYYMHGKTIKFDLATSPMFEVSVSLAGENTKGKFQVGQNMATSGTSISWNDVIALWNNERFKFTYGGPVQLSQVGHYTQLIWATTSLLGCGQSKCGETHFFVCNYGPGGNMGDISVPYINAQKSCSSCQSHCQSQLCDGCNGLVCLNDGIISWDKCTCSCPNNTHYYDGKNCTLNCTRGHDNSQCGGDFYTKSSCNTNMMTIQNCPKLCNVCPYAGIDYKEGSVPLPASSAQASTGLVTLLFSVVIGIYLY